VKKLSGRNGNGTGHAPPEKRKKTEKRNKKDSPVAGCAGNGCCPKKMKSLRTAVAGGTYRVESKKVAGKIVDDAVREIRSRLR
jgi:anti-sigma28 factor (negative regulator of flagellin synthesis)